MTTTPTPGPTPAPPHRLSKSRYTAGVQCHKLLWWKVHDPQAIELQPDKVLQDRFDQGALVGALARERFPGGVLIDLPHHAVEERLAATRAAMDGDAPAIFEATFLADHTFVAVDVLERVEGGWRLVEVKSSSSLKDEHIPDAAVQLHVLRQAGVPVVAVELMHLNKEHRSPDQGDLFCREDITEAAEAALPGIPEELERLLAMLAGPLPQVAIGAQCSEPYACPFHDRCWPDERDHICNLYFIGKKAFPLMAKGITSLHQLPADHKCPPAAQRQLRAIREDRIIVAPGLQDALAPFDCRLGFLDFETVQRAIPPWTGMAPWGQTAAQFSYHAFDSPFPASGKGARGLGNYTHSAWLAEGPEDPRPLIARMLVEATAGQDRVVTYSSFEKTRIRELQRAVPELADDLAVLEAKLLDLLPIVRDYVYHPDFRGSFSMKAILSPLAPDLSYTDLVIVDGMTASVEIARLLFVADRIPVHERDRVRQDLLDYCERDTWAMVRVLGRVRELAGCKSPPGNGLASH